MSLAAGKIRHWIEIQRMGSIVDTQGEVIGEGWTTVASVWAKVEPLSARELLESQAIQSQVTARVTMRYRTDIDHSCRLLHRGQVYNIAGIVPDNSSGLEWLTIPVSAGLNQG